MRLRPRRRAALAAPVLRGVVAGAAGTTALNALTYLDMAVRGRPASTTPERTIEQLSARTHVPVPGEGDRRAHRATGLGLLFGLVAGVAAGAALGMVRALGWRTGRAQTFLAATGAALVVGNGPMTLLRVTDPRTWSATDWLSDVVPHAAYGLAAAAVFDGVDP